MTHDQKFQLIQGQFEDTYPRYYGAGLVSFVLRVADGMGKRQSAQRLGKTAKQKKTSPLSWLFPVFVDVLSAPKGDQGGWEGGARGL